VKFTGEIALPWKGPANIHKSIEYSCHKSCGACHRSCGTS
jgi:hypothetical protein